MRRFREVVYRGLEAVNWVNLYTSNSFIIVELILTSCMLVAFYHFEGFSCKFGVPFHLSS